MNIFKDHKKAVIISREFDTCNRRFTIQRLEKP